MNITKLSIFAEIDGQVCYIPASQFHSLEFALNMLSSASTEPQLKAVKMPGDYKLQEVDIK